MQTHDKMFAISLLKYFADENITHLHWVILWVKLQFVSKYITIQIQSSLSSNVWETET